MYNYGSIYKKCHIWGVLSTDNGHNPVLPIKPSYKMDCPRCKTEKSIKVISHSDKITNCRCMGCGRSFTVKKLT